jgi:hypothetical protein
VSESGSVPVARGQAARVVDLDLSGDRTGWLISGGRRLVPMPQTTLAARTVSTGSACPVTESKKPT